MDVTEILIAVLSLATALITAFLIPYIKSKLSAEQLKQILQVCRIACEAVEEAARIGLIPKEQKFDSALDIIRKHGIKIDDARIKDCVQSTVWELFNQFR